MNTLTLRSRLSDRGRQKFFVTFLGGKLLGLALAFLAIKSLGPWIIAHTADAAGLSPKADETIDQVVSATNTLVGADHRVPRVLHAGRVHDAGGRLRPDA